MSTLKRLETIRQQINAKRSELHALASMPLTPPEVEARVDGLIADWAEQFDTSWLGRQIAAPGPLASDDDLLGVAMAGSRVKPAPLLATLMPAELRRLMVDAAMEHAGVASPTEAERISRQREIEQALHELEIDEERVVCQLEAAGVEVFRRPDADPSVILSTIA